jgi:ribonuclease H2 subunit B
VKVVEYLRVKVARLATPEVFEVSRTLIRGLAKDGLMEDGKEDLLPRPFTVSVET